MAELPDAELLRKICENPGFAPRADDAEGSMENALGRLESHGWIVRGMDGWRGSDKALDRYPDFDPQDPRPKSPLERSADVYLVFPTRLLRGQKTSVPFASADSSMMPDVTRRVLAGSLQLANEGQVPLDLEIALHIKIRDTKGVDDD